MGKFVTIVGIDEDYAKKDTENIHIPDWFIEMENLDYLENVESQLPHTLVSYPDERMSDARLHAESREIKIMLSLFSYMGLDQVEDPAVYICRRTGYGKSFIREVLDKYVKLGFVKIGN